MTGGVVVSTMYPLTTLDIGTGRSHCELPAAAYESKVTKIPNAGLPKPIKSWEFRSDQNLEISFGTRFQLRLDGLHLDRGFAAFELEYKAALKSKTLAVISVLESEMDQISGALISVQSSTCAEYDAVLYGQPEQGNLGLAGKNLADEYILQGCDTPVHWPSDEVVHIAVVYQVDKKVAKIGTFQNGVRIGSLRKAPIILPFGSRKQCVFGAKHTKAGGLSMLGRILSARVYDKALSDEQIAILAGSTGKSPTLANF
jgi:hypothetical protein